MALELNDLDNQSPAFNKGVAVRQAVGTGIDAAKPYAQNALNQAAAPAVAVGTAIGTGAGMAKVAGDKIQDAAGIVGNGLTNFAENNIKAVGDFGRGALGIEPAQKAVAPTPVQTMPKPALSLNEIKRQPTSGLTLNSILPNTGNMPNPAIPAQINNVTAPYPANTDFLKSKPMQNIGAGIGAAPVETSANTPTKQAMQPQMTVLSGRGSIANSVDNPKDGSYIDLSGRKINPNPVQATTAKSTDYRDYMEQRPDNRIDPLQVETGIDASKLAGGAFGGLAALQLAQAAMLPAAAHNKHEKYLTELGNKDRDFAVGQADKEASRQAASATAQRSALENDRDFGLKQGEFGLKQDDSQFNQHKSLAQLAQEDRKQSATESDNLSKNNLAWNKQATDTQTNAQKQDLELKKLKRPIAKTINQYGKDDLGNTHITGQSIVMVDPDTGKVIGDSENQVGDEPVQ